MIYGLVRPTFVSHSQPFPIVAADLQSLHQNESNIEEADDLVPLSNPIFEFNVCKLASIVFPVVIDRSIGLLVF